MNFKRVIMTLLAVLLLPGFAYAQTVTRATFAVSKDFTDDNPATVTVTLDCNTGLPLKQSQNISESAGVNFVVESFTDGQLDCAVTEADVAGYSSDYDCVYDNVNTGTAWECTITNSPDQVDVNVDKVWVIDGSGGDQLDARFELTLICNGQIADFEQDKDGLWRWTVKGNDTGGLGMRARVTPDWDGGTDCWVEESVYDSSVETDNGCQYGSLHIEIGQGASCVVTNTVFYEGIPTLSQYGMAIMALLMLGVGFVGFRRFV